MSQSTDSDANNSRCLLIVGKNGHGKSATGNSILGRKEFATSSSTKSKTKEVNDARAQYKQYDIKIIDGPGLEDTDFKVTEIKDNMYENIAKSLLMCNGGLHAFLFVIKFGTRFTQEERRVLSDLKLLFGENYLKEHGIIVFTGGDNFQRTMDMEDTPNKSFKEWLEDQDESLFQECSHRIVLFNNITEIEQEKENQRNELFQHVDTIFEERGLYTNENFKIYANIREKMEKSLPLLKDNVQSKIEQFISDLGCITEKSTPEDLIVLRDHNDALHKELIKHEDTDKSLKPLHDDLGTIHDIIEELKIAVEEKNTDDIKFHFKELQNQKEKLKGTKQVSWELINTEVIKSVSVILNCAGFGASVAPAAQASAQSISRIINFIRALFNTSVAILREKIQALTRNF